MVTNTVAPTTSFSLEVRIAVGPAGGVVFERHLGPVIIPRTTEDVLDNPAWQALLAEATPLLETLAREWRIMERRIHSKVP